MALKAVSMSVDELLAGLAEECAELAQAALKLRRVYTSENPTPTTEEDAYDSFLEEIADVHVYLNQIPYNIKVVEQIMHEKTERWKKRLETRKRGAHERKVNA